MSENGIESDLQSFDIHTFEKALLSITGLNEEVLFAPYKPKESVMHQRKRFYHILARNSRTD